MTDQEIADRFIEISDQFLKLQNEYSAAAADTRKHILAEANRLTAIATMLCRMQQDSLAKQRLNFSN